MYSYCHLKTLSNSREWIYNRHKKLIPRHHVTKMNPNSCIYPNKTIKVIDGVMIEITHTQTIIK